ncbi:hypothetical protein ZOSMA_344G00090 [Zostera marina]|uniref:TF-B3 domain-containing protein n=1 Tax=Zostera marina TaxID=29655 RepID=A0A0K9P7D2_ZOSMR|nr:hypothetical protein ZOSMA_344G00090 [Zostera marina]
MYLLDTFTLPIPRRFLRATDLVEAGYIESYVPNSKDTFLVKIHKEGKKYIMYGRGWRLFVEKECLMNDIVVEFLYYPSIRKTIIALVTRYGVPASFIDGFVRAPMKLPPFFQRPLLLIPIKEAPVQENTEQEEDDEELEEEGEEEGEEGGGEEGEDEVYFSEPNDESSHEEDNRLDMEWTTTLTKSHVLGMNPYLTLPKKLSPEKLFKVGDPVYILAHPDRLFVSKISTFHSHCHTGYRLQTGWKAFVKELELEVGDQCVFQIMFRIKLSIFRKADV